MKISSIDNLEKYGFRSPLFKSRPLYAPAPMKMITKRRLKNFVLLFYY